MDNSTMTMMFPKNLLEMSFSWIDYLLFTMMLGGSAVIGIYFGCFGTKQSTTSEYLMGDKKMKVFPISMSLIASHISGITLLGVPADVYRFGAGYWLICLSLIFVILATIYIYLPVFFKMQITSTYEYLERRYDNRNRMFASFLFTLTVLLQMPIVIYIPALAFSAATGINVHWITPIICGICIFYTTIGGLKAVVWTDTLQFTVTIGAVLTVFGLGLTASGGFASVWNKAVEGDRLDLFDFDLDPTKRDSFWPVFIGMIIVWMSMVSINQTSVQKYLSVPTLREAKLAVLYFGIGLVGICSFCVFTGLIMYSRYANCDPFTIKAVQRNDQLLPYYIMDVASGVPGLPGLFIAGISCAALSTLSATLNCVAGTLYEDFILKFVGGINDKTSSYLLKIIVIVIGVLCTVLVYVIEQLGGILPLAVAFVSVTGAPLLAMFTLGVLFPKSSSKGTFYGSITGLLFSSWIIFMAQYHKGKGNLVYQPRPTTIEGCLVNFNTTTMAHPLNFNMSMIQNDVNVLTTPRNSVNLHNYNGDRNKELPFILFRISFYYYGPLGFLITIITSLILSYALPNHDRKVSRDLLSPVIYFLLPEEKEKEEYHALDKALKIVASPDLEEV